MQRTLSLLTPLILSLCVSAQSVLRTVNGPTVGGRLGAAMIDAGDLDADGYDDVLVGAPGFNQSRGAVHAVSGSFLATGGGQPSILWTVSPGGLAPGDQFGTSLAAVGDLTGDLAGDFAVGAPYDDNAAGVDAGAVWIIDRVNHAGTSVSFAASTQRFGFSIDAYGDWNGDGKLDLVVGAPSLTGNGQVAVISGAHLAAGGMLPGNLASYAGLSGYGWSIASGFDVEGDGDIDIVAGSPISGTANQGRVDLLRRTGALLSLDGSYAGDNTYEYLGYSVDAAHDYDDDGVIDLVAGAPYSDTSGSGDNGRVVVLSGAALLSGSTTPELLEWTPGTEDAELGASVCASGDLNGDGVGDILAGGPGYGPNDQGRLFILSVVTGEFVGGQTGSSGYRLGEALLGAFDDLDGDGYPEFAVGGPSADPGGVTDAGTLKCMRLFPVHASSYCDSKQNSLGCMPGISAMVGYASASSSSEYEVTGFDFLNQKTGLLFYGLDANDVPFQGGTLCVKQPIVRTEIQNSGGAATGASCTGTYNLDFNARIQSGIDPHLVIGRQVFCQYWSRDPQSPSTTSLSDGLRFLINP